MEAAERIFNGSFDHVVDDDGDVEMTPAQRPPPKPRMIVRAPPISVTLFAYIDPSRHLPTMTTTKVKHLTRKMRMGMVRDAILPPGMLLCIV